MSLARPSLVRPFLIGCCDDLPDVNISVIIVWAIGLVSLYNENPVGFRESFQCVIKIVLR